MSNPLDIKVVVDPNNSLSARVGQESAIRVVSSISKETLSNSLSDLTDVNIPEGISDGNILIYNSSTSKWEVSDEINGGSY